MKAHHYYVPYCHHTVMQSSSQQFPHSVRHTKGNVTRSTVVRGGAETSSVWTVSSGLISSFYIGWKKGGMSVWSLFSQLNFWSALVYLSLIHHLLQLPPCKKYSISIFAWLFRGVFKYSNFSEKAAGSAVEGDAHHIGHVEPMSRSNHPPAPKQPEETIQHAVENLWPSAVCKRGLLKNSECTDFERRVQR